MKAMRIYMVIAKSERFKNKDKKQRVSKVTTLGQFKEEESKRRVDRVLAAMWNSGLWIGLLLRLHQFSYGPA